VDALTDHRDSLTHRVIGSAMEVHRRMGPGLLESVYQRCLEHELKLQGLACHAQARLPLVYKDLPLGDDFVIDFYWPERLVVELKAVEKLLPVHEAQLLTYLRLSNTHVGLLINFNVAVLKDGVKRMVLWLSDLSSLCPLCLCG
jgi:GxxExxY protein